MLPVLLAHTADRSVSVTLAWRPGRPCKHQTLCKGQVCKGELKPQAFKAHFLTAMS